MEQLKLVSTNTLAENIAHEFLCSLAPCVCRNLHNETIKNQKKKQQIRNRTCTKTEHASKTVQRTEGTGSLKIFPVKSIPPSVQMPLFFSFPSSFGEEKIKAKHTWATQQEERMNENLTVLPLCKENIRSQHREKQRLRPLNSCDKSKACTLKLPFVENTVRHNKTEMLGKCKLCLWPFPL